MNNVIKNNQNLLSDKDLEPSTNFKMNNTEQTIENYKSTNFSVSNQKNKSRSIIPILDFDNMNIKITPRSKDSE